MDKILLIDDSIIVGDSLKAILETDYDVTVCHDAESGLENAMSGKYSLILMDIIMPDMDGFTLCQKIREKRLFPIIMLTAKVEDMDKITGLALGADDYITKPFSMPVLVRKIAAVLRRSYRMQDDEHQTICYQNLILDLDSYTAVIDGKGYELTQREFEVLRELLINQGRIMTRQNLLDKLWRYDFYGDERVVDTHIKNLRKKLGIDFIQTIRGVGYKIDKEN